ncbi:TVP38/TMEM64 family protein [Leuconostoc miyukkimchii]|uniref:TVP38/TMEM64 family protein n=1 Tax=Leuconostoc miyukkimchii TaxID=910540 RepID=UPI001C7CD532|nr:TVP38/TMEM64 family protein [Leuconostoc miyukkimchii]
MQKITLSIRKRQMSRRLIKLVSIVGLIATIGVGLYLWRIGLLTNQTLLRQTIHSLGVWGPLAFIGVQMVQVIIPIIPGGITLAVGPMLFGPWLGFVYNYIGIIIGSLVLFQIGRLFGTPLVDIFVSRKTHHKYIDKLNSDGWTKIFIILMVMPMAPDDTLVLLTSLTKMSFKKFTWILVLSKPIGIACYSFALLYGFDWFTKLVRI